MTTSTDGPRMDVFRAAPALYEGMSAFQSAAAKGFDPALAELVRIRVSQINKCAFCLDMHLTEARRAGEDQLRLDLIAAWQEAPGVFDDRERAALALAESVTLLTEGFVPDAVWEEAARHFGEAELAQLLAQIVAINAWNRFQVATRAKPMSLAQRKD